MEVLEITLEEYGNITDNRTNVFCQSNFLRHNLHKTGTVRCFLGHDKKNRLALAVGESEWEWNAPFSAPFSTITRNCQGKRYSAHLYHAAARYLWNDSKCKDRKCFIRQRLPTRLSGIKLLFQPT